MDISTLKRKKSISKSSILTCVIFVVFVLLIILQCAIIRTDEGTLHFEVANYHFVWNRWKEAESEYILAAQNRNDPYIYYYLSLVKIELKDYKGALSAIESSYRFGPDKSLAFKLKELEDWLKTKLEEKL